MEIIRAPGDGIFLARKTVAFDGSAGNGAAGTVALFTVTGQVAVYLMAGHCTEDLTESAPTATIALGVTGATAIFIAATNAVDLDNGEWWVDTGPDANGVLLPAAGGGGQPWLLSDNDDVILTVAAADVDDGTVTFYCHWRPMSAGSSIVSA